MKKRLSIIFLLILGLLLSREVKAKAILLNEDAGLNNIEVTAITKDKNGIMWVATKRGLNKYNGYHFTEISFFKNRFVHAILYDSTRNVIWVGTDIGLFYTNCITGEVTQCTSPDKKNGVTCLAKFNEEIFIGFQQKYIMQIKADFTCKVIHFFEVGRLQPKNMVINSVGDLYLFIGKIIEVSRQANWASKSNVSLRKYTAFLNLANDKVYAGGVNAGIWNINGPDSSDWFLRSPENIARDPECMVESNGLIFMAYRNDTRIIEADPGKRTIKNITADVAAVFSNKRINCLFRDEFDIIWVGTSKGLIKLVPDKPKPVFEKLLSNLGKQISTRQIIGDSGGDLYVGSYAGFYRYHKNTGKWENSEKLYYFDKAQFFTQRSLLNYDDRFIYIGSDANYFVRYDKKNQTFKGLIYSSADSMCNTLGSALALEKDINGIIWIGSERGMLSFDPIHSELKCHIKDHFSVDGSFVRCIYMLPGKRQFWAGTENGIYLIDIEKGMQKHFDMLTVPALGGNLINAITADHNGNIWVATDDAGINVLSADCSSVYSITKEDGLSSNEIYNMLWQDSVRLWISTYNGLDYYQTQTETIIQYFESDGIADNEFNQNSAYKAPDGKMYFGGIKGITAFYPSVMEVTEQPFNVIVSGITKWEKTSGKIVNALPNEQNNITVSPGDNLLTFSFAASDYTRPELHNYFYKIEGHNADWIPLGAQPILRLESLKGGEYQLLIKAVKGSRGVSSANTLVYNLFIEQEFYQTIWFYVLLAIGLAGLIYYYFSSRLRTQEKLEIQRVKIASNLHDEVGSLLTRITMSADRLVTRMPRDSETRDKLEGVSVLSREANVAMSDVLWTIDARNDFTGSLTDRMREHAEDLLLPRGIDVTINFSDIDQSKKLSPEFRQHLFLVYKEIINNIIKHSKAEKVLIIYKQSKNSFLLQVKNDGVSEHKGSVSTGQGLRNIKMRAELIHGKVEIIQGTDEFEVRVMI